MEKPIRDSWTDGTRKNEKRRARTRADSIDSVHVSAPVPVTCLCRQQQQQQQQQRRSHHHSVASIRIGRFLEKCWRRAKPNSGAHLLGKKVVEQIHKQTESQKSKDRSCTLVPLCAALCTVQEKEEDSGVGDGYVCSCLASSQRARQD